MQPSSSRFIPNTLASRPTDVPAGRGPWRVGMISNPLSGRNRRGGLNAVRCLLQETLQIPHREVRTPEEARAALDCFAAEDVNLVVVNSGDGTIQAVLTLLFAQKSFRPMPLLALLSGGTTNMTHRDLGLPGSAADALRRLLNWLYHGEGEAFIRRRAILRVQAAS
jgi:diacylglycerol kinase family enzyme